MKTPHFVRIEHNLSGRPKGGGIFCAHAAGVLFVHEGVFRRRDGDPRPVAEPRGRYGHHGVHFVATVSLPGAECFKRQEARLAAMPELTRSKIGAEALAGGISGGTFCSVC